MKRLFIAFGLVFVLILSACSVNVKNNLALITITFDPNCEDATGSTERIQDWEDKTVTLPQNGFVREGFIFFGWNTKKDGTGGVYQDKDTIFLEENLTLYAQWWKITITFDPNCEDATGFTNSIQSVENKTVTLPQNGFCRKNFTFTGWNTERDGTGTAYNDKATIKLTRNLTLYAQWEISVYTITFDPNCEDATGSTNSVQDLANKSVTLPQNGFSREGFTFVGWNTNRYGGGIAYSDKATIILTKDITLYAQWEISTYTITVETAENGTVSVSDFVSQAGWCIYITTTPDKLYAVEAVTVKDEKNHIITVNSNYPNQYTFNMPETNVTINATFKYIGHSIKLGIYFSDRSVVGEEEISLDGTILKSNKTAAVSGDSFEIYTLLNNCHVAEHCYVDTTEIDINRHPSFSYAMPNKDVTIKLFIKMKSFYISFITGNSTVIQGQTIEWGQKLTPVENLSDTDESEGFLGWYTEPECINEFDFDTPITQELTLYAKWTRIKTTMSKFSQKISALKYQCEIEIDNVPSIGSGYNESIKKTLNSLYASRPEFQIDLVLKLKKEALIGDSAFENCLNLRSIEISGSSNSSYNSPLEDSIGEKAFKDCINLKTVIINKQQKTIKSSAFENCKNLEVVQLPTSISNIEDKAFKSCESLSQIETSSAGGQPVSGKIGDYAFQGCTSLEGISFLKFWKFTEIGNNAFEECTGLMKVDMPSSMKKIGDYAFSGCSNIRDYSFYNVEEIGDYAFKDCGRVDSLIIRASKIGVYAFSNVTVKMLIISDKVEIIQKNSLSGIIIPEINGNTCGVRFNGNDAEWQIKNELEGPVIDTVTVTEYPTGSNRQNLMKYLDKYWIKVQ